MAEEDVKQVLFVRKNNARIDEAWDPRGAAGSDAWDDRALIQAYDRAVLVAKEEVSHRMGLSNDSASGNESNVTNNNSGQKKRKIKKEWQKGDHCRAVYSEDGVTYEATVSLVFKEKGTCVVTYVGYENSESVPLKMLEPSQGPAVRKLQQMTAMRDSVQHSVGMEQGNVKDVPPVQPQPGPSRANNRMDWESRPPAPRFMHCNMRCGRVPPMAVPPMMFAPPPPPHLTNDFPEEDTETLSSMLMSWYMSGFHTGYYQGVKHAKNVAAHRRN